MVEESTKPFEYTVPQLGDNVVRTGKFVRVCTTRLQDRTKCLKPVHVSKICSRSGRVEYSCSLHGNRNRSNMDWLDVTGSTMIEFRKVGL